MLEDKIMAGGNLDDIVARLTYCGALLDALISVMGDNEMVDALAGAHDLLNSICRDFQAAIDSAENYTKGTSI